MKRTSIYKYVLPAAIICMASCVSKNEYTISGKLSDAAFEGKTIYAESLENRGVKIDSAVVTNGTFTMQGMVETSSMSVLKVAGEDNKKFSQIFVLENGTIAVDGDNNAVSGTAQNESLNSLLTVGEEEKTMMSDLYKEYLAAANEDERKAIETRYDSVNNIFVEKAITMAKNVYNINLDNAVGAYAMYEYIKMGSDKGMTLAEIETLLAEATPVIVDFGPTKAILENMRNLENTSVGKQYTDLDLLEGAELSATKLSQHIDGKVALIDFWASWCGPCRAEIPNIAEMHKKYADKGLVVVGLNVWDKPEAQQKTIEAMNMNWLQIADSTKNATNVYGVQGIPQIMLIGKDGVILARDLRGEAIEAAIIEALK